MSDELNPTPTPPTPPKTVEQTITESDLNLPDTANSMLTAEEAQKAPACTTRAMSMDVYLKMAKELRRFHAVFNKFWEIGRPLIVSNHPMISTAAVTFGKEGELLDFYYSEDFWESTSWYERIFTTCHEMLHVLLNHGVRTKNLENRKLANIAADLVVNHLLESKFGFIKELLSGWWRFVWVETVFPAHMKVPTDESLEFYYDLLLKNANEIKIQLLVDQHFFGPGDGDPSEDGNPGGKGQKPGEGEGELCDASTAAQVVSEIAKRLRWQDKKDLDPMMKEHGDPDHTGKDGKNPGGKYAGTGAGNVWTLFTEAPRVKKPRWETIVHKWCKRKLHEIEMLVPQWIFEDRRYTLIPKGRMFLPSESNDRNRFFYKRKVRVVMFLDNSGSCSHMAERFFRAATSIPEDKFEVTVCCYDTVVHKLDLKDLKMIGGGGTHFPPKEEWIQKQIATSDMDSYPDLVFDLTDGYGSDFFPEHPSRWVFFMTEDHSLSYIPSESRHYMLADFE